VAVFLLEPLLLNTPFDEASEGLLPDIGADAGRGTSLSQESGITVISLPRSTTSKSGSEISRY